MSTEALQGSIFTQFRGVTDKNTMKIVDSDEFMVVLTGGLVFFTGGFETVGSLARNMERGTVAGSFMAGEEDWHEVKIAAQQIVAIVDLRSNTGTEDA